MPSNIFVDDKGNFKLRVGFQFKVTALVTRTLQDNLSYFAVSTQTLKIEKNLIII